MPRSHPVADLMFDRARSTPPRGGLAGGAPIAVEPPFETIDDLAVPLAVAGRVTVVTGPASVVRMFVAAVATRAWRHREVALAGEMYAGPGLGDLVASITGVRAFGGDGEPALVERAAAHVADSGLVHVDSVAPWTHLPECEIAVVEPHQLVGELPALVVQAAAASVAVVVPICESEQVKTECRTLRLRDVGQFPSGRCHVTLEAPARVVRLAYSGASGRFE